MWRPALCARQTVKVQSQRRFDHAPLPPYSILFMGAGPVALPCLNALKADFLADQQCVSDLQVVQPFPPPKSNLELRQALAGLQIHQLKDPKSLKGWTVPNAGNGKPFDIGVVVSFKYFLPARVLRGMRLGVINMHPSLLPLYRGAAPIQTCLMNGDSETGVSIIRIEPQEPMDSGSILLQRQVAVPPTTIHGELQAALSTMGAEAVMDTLRDFSALWGQAQKQPSKEGVTFAPKITTQGLVRFTLEDAMHVYNKWRALLDNGGIYGYFQRRGEEDPQRIKFSRVHLPSHLAPALEEELRPLKAMPGALYYPRWKGGAEKRVLAVACAACSPEAVTWVVCSELALECRNVRTAADLANICGWRGGELVPFDGEADCLVEVEDEEGDGAEAR
eukprot:GGOE01041497.1.p1 GENE.GGOE01041497.1~~GGOE01041497.1.p1  ORF type:complete len:391 (+),score=93.69 GGOE01041497.1:44-1216(+)